MAEADTDTLFSYLSYFKDTDKSFAEKLPQEEIEGEVIPGFIKYDNKIVEFAKEYMDLSLGKGDYVDYIHDFLKMNSSVSEWEKHIQQADLETVRSFLTFFVRKEQFKNGKMEWACQNGIIYHLLFRLKEVL